MGNLNLGAGQLKADQWVNNDGTENFKCRAWVNFNGTGTVAIRASGNVLSITDNGVGDWTINFVSALPDVNYSFAIGSWNAVSLVNDADQVASVTGLSTTSFRVNHYENAVLTDTTVMSITVFR